MSIAIPGIDLSSQVAGGTGSVDISGKLLQPTMQQQSQGVTSIGQVFNESGCGLQISYDGDTDSLFIPAGGWRTVQIMPNVSKIKWYVDYILPSAPVSRLLIVLYQPGEPVEDIGVLGNSPIGVSGNVQTSNVQTLTNDGNPTNTQVIEMTPSGQGSSSVLMRNDGSMFHQVLSANVLRRILNAVYGGTVSKAVFDIGDAGDLTITTYHGVFDAGCSFPAAQVAAGVLSGLFTHQSANLNAPESIHGQTADPGASNQDLLEIVRNGTGGNTFRFGIDNAGQLYCYDVGAAKNAFDRVSGTNRMFTGRSAGGGAPGRTIWEGTTQPAGGEVQDGDIWIGV